MAKARSPWPKRTRVANTDLNRFRYEVGGEFGSSKDGNDAIQKNSTRSTLKQQAGSKATRTRQPE